MRCGQVHVHKHKQWAVAKVHVRASEMGPTCRAAGVWASELHNSIYHGMGKCYMCMNNGW